MSASDERLASEKPESFAHAWAGLLAQAILWGALLAISWNLGQRWFVRHQDIWYVPAAIVLVIMFFGPYRRALVCLGQLTGRSDAHTGQAVVCLTAVAFGMVLLTTRPWPVEAPYEPVLPFWLDWFWPNKEGSRVLLLMPIWGSWGMLIVGHLCRSTERTEKAVIALFRGCGPVTAVGSILLPLCGTWYFFAFLGPWQHMAMSGFAVAAAIIAGIIFCWRCGGLSRAVLLSVNLAVQMAFLLGSLYGRARS